MYISTHDIKLIYFYLRYIYIYVDSSYIHTIILGMKFFGTIKSLFLPPRLFDLEKLETNDECRTGSSFKGRGWCSWGSPRIPEGKIGEP